MKELTIKKETLDVVRQMVADGQVSQEVAEKYFPELRESESERIRKELITWLQSIEGQVLPIDRYDAALAWLEKQGEQKPTQEIEPFEAEHGKYYYCIKDYFCGGRKQASKGDVVQALRGLPIMGLKDAGEYFLPVNSIKCNSAWSEEDELHIRELESLVKQVWTTAEHENDKDTIHKMSDLSFFLKILKPQPKQEWSEKDEEELEIAIDTLKESGRYDSAKWVQSLKQRIGG